MYTYVGANIGASWRGEGIMFGRELMLGIVPEDVRKFLGQMIKGVDVVDDFRF
jgi:hypothetical protein